MFAMLILGIVIAVYAMLGCTLFASADPYYFGSFSRAYFTMFQVRSTYTRIHRTRISKVSRGGRTSKRAL